MLMLAQLSPSPPCAMIDIPFATPSLSSLIDSLYPFGLLPNLLNNKAWSHRGDQIK